jgi:hypothetical protein
MNRAQPLNHVLLLTPQEHEEVFTKLLVSIDQTKAQRLTQILVEAETRGNAARREVADLEAKLRALGPRGWLGMRSSFTTLLLWVILLALFVAFYNIFSRS